MKLDRTCNFTVLTIGLTHKLQNIMLNFTDSSEKQCFRKPALTVLRLLTTEFLAHSLNAFVNSERTPVLLYSWSITFKNIDFTVWDRPIRI